MSADAPRVDWHRRDVLQAGSLGVSATVLGGLGLEAAAARSGPGTGKAESVIFLWIGGGMTHIDSFDPKPEAPEEIRGELTAISTRLPGVQFCETLPRLAKVADRLSVVRSYSHDSNDHLLSQVYTLSGRKVKRNQLFSEPNIGAIVSHLYGPRNGLPGYIAVPGITRPGPPPHNLFVGGWLGNQYAPFCVGGRPDQPDFTVGKKLDNPPSQLSEDLRPRELVYPRGLDQGRLGRRVRLLDGLQQAAREVESNDRHVAVDGHYDNALNLLLSAKVREAFDLRREDASLRDDYGRTKIGGRCLQARRLVEAGARFVMVDYGYDPDYGNLFDIHNAPSQNFPHVSKMVQRGYNVVGVDRAFAALVRDLEGRGLLDETLVVFLTEFGRTPKINARGGRDHWGACGSVFFAGAGIRGGQVVGQSDKQAAYPTTRPYGPADIAATIYRVFGIDIETRVRDRENKPVAVLDHGSPIEAVLA
ncbi:MAG: hypothetical protein CMJ65_07800 [Planctomycetaceae bacterium]|jgi:hypothetical protein|nr:hypothetical protein [Planctomycetaceae bacterium]MDP7277079.1 DUF1501 domain-containing protein [Planctomycetaceae bacterium]